MNVYNIAICDDESRILPIIKRALEKEFDRHGIPVSISAFTSAEQFEVEHMNHPFSLLFLDIDMPGMDGISLGKKLRRNSDSPRIIFLSNRDELVFQALSVHPFCFIRKSHFQKELPQIVSDLILDDKLKNMHLLTVRTMDEIRSIPIGQILYIECIRKDQYIHHSEGVCQVHYTLNYFEEQLKPYGFLKPHKGFLVNYQYIRNIGSREMLLISGESVPISRLKASEIKQEYLKLML
ncbi:MAG: LytTR family DNA-binding domain-containing protein [Lachnospiraceae bacterium]|nr:LytTR family DNA-binding domain-containing protein [Robinsoniella sp.]MDY3765724.1 LytTR family DNA-binding domain-containing protein [Lachnospiraceae bacterium]